VASPDTPNPFGENLKGRQVFASYRDADHGFVERRVPQLPITAMSWRGDEMLFFSAVRVFQAEAASPLPHRGLRGTSVFADVALTRYGNGHAPWHRHSKEKDSDRVPAAAAYCTTCTGRSFARRQVA
jgi:hypothetical protein